MIDRLPNRNNQRRGELTLYRASPGWSLFVLERLPLRNDSDDFVFDNQMLVQAAYFGFRIGEVSCPTNTSQKRRRSILGAA